MVLSRHPNSDLSGRRTAGGTVLPGSMFFSDLQIRQDSILRGIERSSFVKNKYSVNDHDDNDEDNDDDPPPTHPPTIMAGRSLS